MGRNCGVSSALDVSIQPERLQRRVAAAAAHHGGPVQARQHRPDHHAHAQRALVGTPGRAHRFRSAFRSRSTPTPSPALTAGSTSSETSPGSAPTRSTSCSTRLPRNSTPPRPSGSPTRSTGRSGLAVRSRRHSHEFNKFPLCATGLLNQSLFRSAWRSGASSAQSLRYIGLGYIGLGHRGSTGPVTAGIAHRGQPAACHRPDCHATRASHHARARALLLARCDIGVNRLGGQANRSVPYREGQTRN